MPGQCRLGDKSNVPADAHGCPACPHPAVGPAIIDHLDRDVDHLGPGGTVEARPVGTDAGKSFSHSIGTLRPGGDSPGPYRFDFYTDSFGELSPRFGLAPNDGTPDGITTRISLTKGLPYSVGVSAALTDEPWGMPVAEGAVIRCLLGSQEIGGVARTLERRGRRQHVGGNAPQHQSPAITNWRRVLTTL